MGFAAKRYSKGSAWLATAPAPPSSIPATAGLLIAATRPEVKDSSTISPVGVTGLNSQVPHRFPNGAGQRLMLCYDNFGVGWDANTSARWGTSPIPSPYDNGCPSQVAWSCSLSETDGSVFYQGRVVRVRHADGTVTDYSSTLPTTVTVTGADSVDFIVDLGVGSRAPGTWLTEHCFKRVVSGDGFFVHSGTGVGALRSTRNEACSMSSSEIDKTMQMMPITGPSPAPGAAWASSIRHIDAPPSSLRHPTIAVGDSLMGGFNYGWGVNFQQDAIPYVNVARSTEPASSWLSATTYSKYRRSQVYALGGYTRAVVQYLTNDAVANGQTLTLWKSERDTIVAALKALGALKVAVGVLPPNTDSSDNWGTLGNQWLRTTASGYPLSNRRGDYEALMQAYNADLRQGAAYGAVTPQAWVNPQGFITVDGGGANEVLTASAHPADTPEPIRAWYVDGSGNATTADGLHPGTLGATRWAAAIPDDFFDTSKG